MRFCCRFWILVVGFLALNAVACSSYTLRAAQLSRLEDRAPIAIAVMSTADEDAPVAGTVPTVLEQYLTTALLKRGYDIRVTRPELLTTQPLQEALVVAPYTDLTLIDVDVNGEKGPRGTSDRIRKVKTEDASNGNRNLARSKGKGKGKGKDKKPIRNELVDAHSRHKALLRLAASIRKEWGIKYLVFAHEFDDYGFAAQVIRLEDKRLIYSMVVSGNKDGFEQALGQLKNGSEQTSEGYPADNSKYLRFAEFLAEQI